MGIRIKLGGELKRYGDTGALESQAPITVAQVMTKLGIEEGRGASSMTRLCPPASVKGSRSTTTTS